MIFSLENIFSNDQAITTSAASTNVIDLGSPGTVLNAPYPLNRDMGKGTPVPILIQVTEDFATLTSLAVKIEVSDDEAFGVIRTVIESEAVPAAQLIAGFKFPIMLLPWGVDLRFVRLYYTVGGSAATAGTITAGIVPSVQTGSVAGGLAA